MKKGQLASPLKALAGFLFVAGLIGFSGPIQAQEQPAANQEVQEPEVADPAYHALEVAKGQALVEKHCASCHAIGTADASPHKQAPPFRDVVTRYPAEHLAEALAEGIQSGHPDMPVFVFEPDDINAFLAFLDSLAPQTER